MMRGAEPNMGRSFARGIAALHPSDLIARRAHVLLYVYAAACKAQSR